MEKTAIKEEEDTQRRTFIRRILVGVEQGKRSTALRIEGGKQIVDNA